MCVYMCVRACMLEGCLYYHKHMHVEVRVQLARIFFFISTCPSSQVISFGGKLLYMMSHLLALEMTFNEFLIFIQKMYHHLINRFHVLRHLFLCQVFKFINKFCTHLQTEQWLLISLFFKNKSFPFCK